LKVLIGEISSYKAIVIAKFLKTNYPGIVLITYDYLTFIKKVHTKYSDEHITLNARSGKAYIDELIKLCHDNVIDMFIPVHSDNVGSILQAKGLFGKALSYTGNFDQYLRLHNKDVLQTLARELEIDTPNNYLSFKEARIPFVVKPTNKSSSKGVLYFTSEKSKGTFYLEHENDIIIQEFIEGFGCGYSVFVRDGKVLVGYGHKRLAEYPISGGSSVYRTSFFDPRMHSIAEKLFNEVPWSGFAMIEFKFTPDNRLVLIEVNPRIWGSVNQGLQCGINYFEPLFGIAKFNKRHKEVNTYLSPQIYLSLLQYILRFNCKPLIDFIINIRKNNVDLSLINDPRAYLSVILRKILK